MRPAGVLPGGAFFCPCSDPAAVHVRIVCHAGAPVGVVAYRVGLVWGVSAALRGYMVGCAGLGLACLEVLSFRVVDLGPRSGDRRAHRRCQRCAPSGVRVVVEFIRRGAGHGNSPAQAGYGFSVLDVASGGFRSRFCAGPLVVGRVTHLAFALVGFASGCPGAHMLSSLCSLFGLMARLYFRACPDHDPSNT